MTLVITENSEKKMQVILYYNSFWQVKSIVFLKICIILFFSPKKIFVPDI